MHRYRKESFFFFFFCLCVLFLRSSGALDSDHTHHVPARLLEDVAEGAQVLLWCGNFLLRALRRGLHHLPGYFHQRQRV